MTAKMPTFKKGEYPKAADLDLMARTLEQLINLRVSENSGLTLDASATGFTLGLTLPPRCRYANTNSVIPKYSSSNWLPGTGILQSLSYHPTTHAATLTPLNTTSVKIYNGSNSDIPSGRRIMVEEVNGRWHVVVDFCPT